MADESKSFYFIPENYVSFTWFSVRKMCYFGLFSKNHCLCVKIMMCLDPSTLVTPNVTPVLTPVLTPFVTLRIDFLWNHTLYHMLDCIVSYMLESQNVTKMALLQMLQRQILSQCWFWNIQKCVLCFILEKWLF